MGEEDKPEQEASNQGQESVHSDAEAPQSVKKRKKRKKRDRTDEAQGIDRDNEGKDEHELSNQEDIHSDGAKSLDLKKKKKKKKKKAHEVDDISLLYEVK